MTIKKYYVTVDVDGTTYWYKDAKCKILHRENGPAIEYSDGDKAWYINGEELTEAEFKLAVKNYE